MTDLEFDKNIGQFRQRLYVLMEPLRKYGQDVYVTQACKEIESLTVQFWQKMEGVDEPYWHNNIHW